jgi:hypothetical protein
MKALLEVGSGAKVALGAALASVGGVLLVLSPAIGWYPIPGPWEFPLGFSTGLFAGLGTLLALVGLVDSRRNH